MKYLPFFLLVLFFACKQANDPTTAKNEATVRAAYDAVSQHNWEAFAALCSPDFTDINAGPMPAEGIEASVALYKQFQETFPDFKVTIDEIVPVSPTRFLLRTTFTATNTGPFMGMPATGKSVSFHDADIVELDANGKAISHSVTNTGEPFRQIGYGSLTNPNTGLIMSVYEKFGKGDIDGLLNMCDDKVVFDVEDRVFDSKARHYEGKDGIAQFFKEVNARNKYSKFQPTRYVADGDDVFTTVEVAYNNVPTGRNYTSTYTHHFKVQNGKLTYFRGVDDFQREQAMAGK